MDIREELLQNNPFSSAAAANPWENSSPDIPSLNSDICDQIFYLINKKAQSPQLPLAGLILGDAGSGKTHMLKRILDRIRRENINAIFVNVRAFSVPESVMRDLWREIFVSMLREHSGKNSRFRTTQFNFIVSGMMNIYRRSNALKGISSTGSADGIRYFQNKLPGIHVDFLKAIFAYCDPFSEERRQAALGWFHGNSDDEFPAVLGVHDRNSMSAYELEGEAEKIILSLGLILDLCGASTVVCFDQLDAMDDKVLINAWGRAATFLINDVFSMMPLAFLKNTTWTKFFLPVLSDYVEERFLGNRFALRNCTLEQARELIQLRVTSLFGEDSDDKCEWIMEQLRNKLKNGYSPRIVLNLANQAILNHTEPDDILRTLDSEYREECGKVAADFAMWPPDAEHLCGALEIYLNHHVSFKEIKRSDDKDNFIFLTGLHTAENAPERNCAFIINTGEHHMAVSAALKRGVSFLNKNQPDGICYYITDGRCNFPGPNKWQKVHAELSNFEELGGRTLFLDQGQAVSWYGLNELRIKVKSGDVTFLSSGGEVRAAGSNDLKLYLERGFGINFLAL